MTSILPVTGFPRSPVLTSFQAAYAAHHTPNRAPWRGAKASEARMRAVLRMHEDAALAERGALLADALNLPALDAACAYPSFIAETYRWAGGSLLDHMYWYRVTGTRGPASRKNTVVVGEPYMSDEAVPDALADWMSRLAKTGLTVKQLSKDLLIHAPDNPASQIFLIGSPAIIGHLA